VSTPGTRIELDGALNLRDVGGWDADGGVVAHGQLFRSDRLSELSDADLARFDELGVRTVIDLRHGHEVDDAPSKLWATVDHHHNIPMTGDSVQPRTFLEMAFSGEMDGITDVDVGEIYIGMLTRHATDFGRAINLAVSLAPSLFHCTAGKDRTGLFAMLVLGSLGVSDDDVLTDFTLSNVYRAEQRIEQLAPLFAERGLDVEDYRPALSAPQRALEMAIEWVGVTYGGPADYLVRVAGMSDDDLATMRSKLIT
jgi:protein-tyrosine phosphatase